MRLPREPQMLRPVERPALQVIGYEPIEEKEVHCDSQPGSTDTTAIGSLWSRCRIDERRLPRQPLIYRELIEARRGGHVLGREWPPALGLLGRGLRRFARMMALAGPVRRHITVSGGAGSTANP